MSIRLADTLEPMSNFPAVMAKHTQFNDGETLQDKFDNGELGSSSSSSDAVPQFIELPTPSVDIAGQVVQYTGNSTVLFTHNFFYECVLEEETYKWKSTSVMPVPVKLSELENDTGFITINTDKLINYYNKLEVDGILGKLNRLTSKIVEELPSQDISETTIYLIKVAGQDTYMQHMYIGGVWASLGSTSVSLDGYVSKEQLQSALADYAKSTDLQTHMDNTDIHVTKEKQESWDKLLTGSHTHGNKTSLDKITDTKINNWDGAVTAKHTHGNSGALSKVINTGNGSMFLSNNANYISPIVVGTSKPQYASQLWIDNTDADNPIPKVNDGSAWIEAVKIAYDTEMLDDSDNLVRNKTIKRYVDNKMRGAGGSSMIAEREW